MDLLLIMNSKNKKLIRLEEITLTLEESEDSLPRKAAMILDLPETEILSCKIVRQNIDARQRQILFVYSLDVAAVAIDKIKNWQGKHRVRVIESYVYEFAENLEKEKIVSDKKIVVVGSGPCGLFAALLLAKAGLKPLVIERGKTIDERVKDVENFFQNRKLNTESNIQFGEGGAGTFSDGKLYTLVNDPRSQYIFSEMIKAGAPAEIAWSGTPHIGTDKLRVVIKNLRAEIMRQGGEFRFETCLTDLEIDNDKLTAIILNRQERLAVDELVLATGHSARDTYKMLYEKNLAMKAKAFAIGVRIEHQTELINRARYGNNFSHPRLGTAKYKLVQHLDNARSVYTFCMCPGGYVVGATSEEGAVVTNGISEYAQDGENSNSALLVPVTPADFATDHPLAGIEFQREWERKAFVAGGSDYSAPAQLVGDFLAGKKSSENKNVNPTYRPGIKFTSLDECLPNFVAESLRQALPLLDRKLKGFADPEAVLTGNETRSSSPVRLKRNENLEANIEGIYPAGEGAGHAGGIVSSALDGLKVAEKIIVKSRK